MVREGADDPGEFAGTLIGDVIAGILIAPVIITITVLVILFLLSFTTILGGPFGIAKFFFFIIFFGTAILFSFLWKLSRIAKSITKQTVNDTIEVTSKVIK